MSDTPTRFRARILHCNLVPSMDRDLSSQCGLPVEALRLRLSVSHSQLETEVADDPTKWEPLVESDGETNYRDYIAELLVGYAAGEIHLSGDVFPFRLSALGKVWVWSPSPYLRTKFLASGEPRRTSPPGRRVIHQFSFPTYLQLVKQPPVVETPAPAPLALLTSV
jgi:hypothetical protein